MYHTDKYIDPEQKSMIYLQHQIFTTMLAGTEMGVKTQRGFEIHCGKDGPSCRGLPFSSQQSRRTMGTIIPAKMSVPSDKQRPGSASQDPLGME